MASHEEEIRQEDAEIAVAVPQRDKRGRLLPGSSGNPTGRGKVPLAFRIATREFMAGHGWEKLFLMAKNVRRAYKPDIQLRALELVAAYAYGRPAQRHEIMTDEDGSRAIIAGLSELMAAQLARQPEQPAIEGETRVLGLFPRVESEPTEAEAGEAPGVEEEPQAAE